MKSTEREKLCSNCEGRIPMDEEMCPYCVTHQTQGSEQNSFQAPLFDNQSLQDSLTSLYTPPYQGKRPLFNPPDGEQPLPSSPITAPTESSSSSYREVVKSDSDDLFEGATVPQSQEELKQSSLVPTVLLIGGAQFAVVGLMQLLFSKDGVLRLEWNANYWFFYFLLSAPLFYFGHKKLKHLKD